MGAPRVFLDGRKRYSDSHGHLNISWAPFWSPPEARWALPRGSRSAPRGPPSGPKQAARGLQDGRKRYSD
eukprot:1191462-Pyramimonas_sp.AAC.1